MRTIRMLALVASFALLPAGASAAGPWWGWLEELSGPGPFSRLRVPAGAYFRLGCVLNDGSTTTCLSDSRPDIRRVVELRTLYVTTGDNQSRLKDKPDDTRSVDMLWINPVLFFRLDSTLDVGAGAGYMLFKGEGFDPVHRFTITPLSVSFVPFAFLAPAGTVTGRFTRVLRLRFDETLITKGFTGENFGNPKSAFSTGSELRTSVGIVVDLGSLIR